MQVKLEDSSRRLRVARLRSQLKGNGQRVEVDASPP
jgi:hypothetical protein